jgi:membrane protein implicated in regulation of membrane protease activity
MMGAGIMPFIASLGAWKWVILGAILLALELALPGAFMMWLGLAAILVGLISFAVDWSWQAQLVAFAIFTAASVPLWRRFARKVDPQLESPYLNRRTDALVGRVFTLDKPIADGVGTVRIDDTVWRVSGPDAAAGSRVRVIRAEGANLTVEPA